MTSIPYCDRCSRVATHPHTESDQPIGENLCDHCCQKNCRYLNADYWECCAEEQEELEPDW